MSNTCFDENIKNFRRLDEVKKYFKEKYYSSKSSEERRKCKEEFYSLKNKFSEPSLDKIWESITNAHRLALIAQLDETFLFIFNKD